MAKKIRVYELAKELGLTNKETVDLSLTLGIDVKSHSSSIEDAQADRVRRKADAEGLRREVQPEEPTPAKKTPAKKAAAAKKAVGAKKAADPTTAVDGEQEPAAPARRVISSRPVSDVTPAPAPTAKPSVPDVAAQASPAPAAPAPTATTEVVGDSDVSDTAPVRRPLPPRPPVSGSGRAIPPPPRGAAPTSATGRPIPPPPGPPGRRPPTPGTRPGGGQGAGSRPGFQRPMGGPSAGPRPGGAGGGARSGGGPGSGPGGGPGGFAGAGGPPPGGRGGPPGRGGQRPPQRRAKRRRRNQEELEPTRLVAYQPSTAPVPDGEIIIERGSTARDLGSKLNRSATDVIRFLLLQGEMVTATQSLTDDMMELFAAELGAEIKLVDPGEEQEAELLAKFFEEDDEEDEGESLPRPPVVTVMGHVDHGKTLLLDRIRSANVVAGEAGGITQHIGAYQVVWNGHPISFIDTPGHEAFTAMRARGAQVTDIVILVVAADDGVMPQTVEAIDHAKAADVPIIVAVNKMDRPDANADRILQQLAERELVPEKWGGETIVVEVSALQSTGIDELLEQVVLVAEVEELTAPISGRARGTVLEANLEVGRGPVATVMMQRGILSVGDPVVAGAAWGKVKALINDAGQQVKSAGPSTPVQILGFSEPPQAGDEVRAATDLAHARTLAEAREQRMRLSSHAPAPFGAGGRLEYLFEQIQRGETVTLNVVLKADVQGSLEACTESLRKLEREDVKLSFVRRGVGGINENDVQLAKASNATIIGFNVRPDRRSRDMAESEGVQIRTYEIIYKLIEDIEAAMLGMLAPEYEEIVTGEAEVREVFRIPKIGAIAGCYVLDGVITRGSKVRFLREGTIIWRGSVNSLRRFKEDTREVASGFECGIGLTDYQDLKEGDIIETFEEREIART